MTRWIPVGLALAYGILAVSPWCPPVATLFLGPPVAALALRGTPSWRLAALVPLIALACRAAVAAAPEIEPDRIMVLCTAGVVMGWLAPGAVAATLLLGFGLGAAWDPRNLATDVGRLPQTGDLAILLGGLVTLGLGQCLRQLRLSWSTFTPAVLLALALAALWPQHLEVPVLTRIVVASPDGRWAPLPRWALGRLLRRTDGAALEGLLQRLRDGRLVDVMGAGLRLKGPAWVTRLLQDPEWWVRRAALAVLSKATVPAQGGPPLDAAMAAAMSAHHGPWPVGRRASRVANPAPLLAALRDRSRRRDWYPALEALLTAVPAAELSRRLNEPGPAGPPGVCAGLARLLLWPGSQEQLPTAALRMLWHPDEGIRLAAAWALLANPQRAGLSGEGPQLARLYREALAGDRANPEVTTPLGPTAPIRVVLFFTLLRREQVVGPTLVAALDDPVPAIAGSAALELAVREGTVTTSSLMERLIRLAPKLAPGEPSRRGAWRPWDAWMAARTTPARALLTTLDLRTRQSEARTLLEAVVSARP